MDFKENREEAVSIIARVPKSVWYCLAAAALFFVLVFASTSCKSPDKPPVTEIISANKDLNESNVKNAINEVSPKKVTTEESRQIVTRIEHVVRTEEPTLEYKVKTPAEEVKAKKKVEETATNEKRDVVIGKEKDDGKTIQYYGITMERRNALGLYADLDSDGSIGAYYRRDRTTIAVGEKYNGGITARISQDIVKW